MDCGPKITVKNGSDIDLSIIGNLDYSCLLKLENQLDDLLLPYKIDLLLHDQVTYSDLLDHTRQISKVFRQEAAV